MSWEGFIEMEREQLRQRREGKLRRALGVALPGESSEQRELVAEQDRQRAERGLVSLEMAGGKITYKHIGDLTRQDMSLILAAERVEVKWLKERTELLKEPGKAPPSIPEHLRRAF